MRRTAPLGSLLTVGDATGLGDDVTAGLGRQHDRKDTIDATTGTHGAAAQPVPEADPAPIQRFERDMARPWPR